MPQDFLVVSHKEIQAELRLSNIFTPEEKQLMSDSWELMSTEDQAELLRILKHEREEYHKMHETMQKKIHEIFSNFVAQIKSIHWNVKKEINVISETKNQKFEDKIISEIESEIENL